jgi:signal transduction histidine kinase
MSSVPGSTNLLAAAARTTSFRLTAIYVALFVLAAAAIVGSMFWQTNNLLTRQVLQSIEGEAEGLKVLAQSAGPGALTEAIAERSRSSGPNLYYLADAEGRKLAGNLNRWPPELRGEADGGLFRYAATPGTDEVERLALGVPVPLSGGQSLLVSRDIEELRAFIDRVRRLFLWGFGCLAITGLVGGIAAGQLILKRIAKITATSETIMAGDLSRRVPLSGADDELDHLARNLNAMLDRIEQLMTGLREVSDNIAHDLKTPLNRLRNRVEGALRDPRGAEAYREGLEHTLEDADELIKTFNALLLIARLEAGAIEESLDTFDLGALVRDVAELYGALAEEKGLELALDMGGPYEVRANRQLIGQAVANLLDNAIKYGAFSPAASAGPGDGAKPDIRVMVTRSAEGVEIAVGDRGPGIPVADRERVLKRFVRLEASRTRPGTGLGLSLVAAVARLHGGGVRLEDNAPGLRAVFAMPVRMIGPSSR